MDDGTDAQMPFRGMKIKPIKIIITLQCREAVPNNTCVSSVKFFPTMSALPPQGGPGWGQMNDMLGSRGGG